MFLCIQPQERLEAIEPVDLEPDFVGKLGVLACTGFVFDQVDAHTLQAVERVGALITLILGAYTWKTCRLCPSPFKGYLFFIFNTLSRQHPSHLFIHQYDNAEVATKLNVLPYGPASARWRTRMHCDG